MNVWPLWINLDLTMWFSPDVPKPRDPPPPIDTTAADKAEADAAATARRKKGKAATQLANPVGGKPAQLGDSGQPGQQTKLGTP